MNAQLQPTTRDVDSWIGTDRIDLNARARVVLYMVCPECEGDGDIDESGVGIPGEIIGYSGKCQECRGEGRIESPETVESVVANFDLDAYIRHFIEEDSETGIAEGSDMFLAEAMRKILEKYR